MYNELRIFNRESGWLQSRTKKDTDYLKEMCN